MKKNNRPKVYNTIANVVSVLALLYLIFAQEWVYFIVLSMFTIVLLLMEIARSTKEVKPSITIHATQTSLKDTDASELAKQILKQLDALEKRGL